MKANELMIGDWVYDAILKCNTQVEMLSLSGIRGDCHDNIWVEKTFEPIPLTPKILEKNDWYCHNSYGKWEHNRDYFDLEQYGGGEFSVEVAAHEEGYATFCYIKYVHELQHLLRLCGAWEIADNFKV